MVVIGLICGGGPLVTFAVLLGLIALVMELLPQIGPIISYIPALLLAAVTSPLAVVLVSIFYFIAFNIEGSILVPNFEGKMLDFGGATVIFLITMGFLLAGIIGAILSLPVAMAARGHLPPVLPEDRPRERIRRGGARGAPAPGSS